MSDLSSALENLYSNFVLRDILSFIIPGAIVCITFLKLFLPEIFRILFDGIYVLTDILFYILLLGFFYIVGFSIQIFREIITRLYFKCLNEEHGKSPANFVNGILNPEPEIWETHVKLQKVYKRTGQFKEKSIQNLERFTIFFQLSGNSCIAFFIGGIAFLMSDWKISVFFFIFCFLTYIGYVIHKERYNIWSSVILNEQISKTSLPDERLHKLFLELRDKKGIIDKKIRLVKNKTTLIQGLNFFGMFKRIRYNPVFADCLSKYNDNIIRFILLHEAGHIANESFWLRIENIIVVLLVIALGMFIPINIFIVNPLYKFLLSVLVFLIFLVALRMIIVTNLKSMKNLEFEADEYAIKKMKDHLTSINICSFIDEIQNALDSFETDPILGEKLKFSWLQKTLIKLCGLTSGYHPTNVERAKRLKEISRCE